MGDYAELHCHSNFSFLDGGSHPDELASVGARLNLSAMAITDHNGLYGVVKFAEAARELNLRTVFGAELTLAPGGPRTGEPDPTGHHLIVIARDPDGYARLSNAISEAHLKGGEKGRPIFDLDSLANSHGGHWLVLTACRKGAVPATLVEHGPLQASRQLASLIDKFGVDNVYVEIWNHGDPLDTARNDALSEIAIRNATAPVATNNVHYATGSQYRLTSTLAAVRANKSLEELDGWLHPSPSAHLRSGATQAKMMARWPGTVELAAELGLSCAFDLKLVAPRLPNYEVPVGHCEQSFLEELVTGEATRRYGPRDCERVHGAWKQIDHELSVIGALGYAGYFLIVWDIVGFCTAHNIYCQGRGSAANSAVCYALGITRADAVSLGLLFERFLSPARDGPPDIDLDIESGRREEVIQYVYEKYGRRHAALVANVISYRARSAIRDVGRALGYSPEQVDAWSKSIDRGESLAGARQEPAPPELLTDLVGQVLGFPRHLGIHPGGMVVCDRPVTEVCPVEWARMEGRTVLQWDKDDCAAIGLTKFDLLGLGMLEALHRCVDLIGDHHGVEIDLAEIPQEDRVYEMLCEADTIGVFQVESRAQMATLPRLKPRCFYDLVVQVALIRPGPIQGNAVHPYLRRRAGTEEVSYLHPSLDACLGRTLGVPIFQEQLMQMSIHLAGFSPAEADELRQAMSSKRSGERMERLRHRLFAGMELNGITGETAEKIYVSLAAFANFGFPESHSVSFAYLVYASAWLKLHFPAAFCASLLNSQPMGFWSPQSLIADAQRHGIQLRPPMVGMSHARATLEPTPTPAAPAIRIGLASVRNVSNDMAERITSRGPYESVEDLVRRGRVDRKALESLAMAGALGELQAIEGSHRGTARRRALWAAGPLSQSRPDRLPGIVTGGRAPDLPPLEPLATVAADLWSMGMTTGPTAIAIARERLDQLGVLRTTDLVRCHPTQRVRVGGVVTHRQRPETARGTTFINLEDETGTANIIVTKGAWIRYRDVAQSAGALLVTGRVEREGIVVNIQAERLEALDLGPTLASRDFR